jgi:hypothetical protein
MALINCPDCNTEVSDKAIQCPKCAYPISTLRSRNLPTNESPKAQNITVNIQQPNLNYHSLLAERKSEGLAFLLLFLFGPFGLLYANPKRFSGVIIGTIMLVVVSAIIIANYDLGYSVAGLIGFTSWITSIVLGMQGVTEHNNSLLETHTTPTINFEQAFDQIGTLRKLIKEEKARPFYTSSRRPEILRLLNSLCDTKENTGLLLKEYSSRYNLDLLEDLKNLSNSYDNIHQNLQNFIEYGFVDSRYEKR